MYLPQLSLTVTSAPELLLCLNQNPSSPAQGDSSAGLNESDDSNSLPASGLVTLESSRPSLFALIIGINIYKNHPTPKNLGGATQDADAVQAFLISELRVPAERIINLRNEQATREAILEAIEGLAQNPDIGANDPILIYYAGHGGEARAPEGWQTSTKTGLIQMLIPHDFAFTGSQTFEGQGVFDFKLGKLLEGLAKKKSDNITVIFDCCHSGSGTRKPGRDLTYADRSVKLPSTYTIPVDVLGEDRDLVIPKGFENAGLRSHVLLSGCKDDQLSGEVNGRGLFTSALLPVLQSDGVDKLTYEEVLKRLPPIPGQDPQCEGVNQKRVFFDAKVASPGRALVPIFNKNDVISLKAGEAYGVTTNAQFAVYSDRKMTSLLGHVAVTATGAFESICKPVEDEGAFTFSEAFALQTRVGDAQDLAVAIQPDEKFLDVFAKIGQEMQLDSSKRSFRVVSSLDEQPQLALSKTEDDKVVFHILDKICRTYGLTKSPFDDVGIKESDYILEILRSAADFYWNLRNSARTPTPLTKVVDIECLKLAGSGDYNEDLSEVLTPVTEDNLIVNKQIVIDVDEEGMYGLRLKNRSILPLWAAVFYFSPGDLSIKHSYLLGSALSGADCSIPAKGSLTVGYGDSGTIPLDWSLKEGRESDVGFLKIYLATEYVDWSGITQSSPFRTGRDFQTGVPKPRVLWDTVTIPVVQQRLGKDPNKLVTVHEDTLDPAFASLFSFNN